MELWRAVCKCGYQSERTNIQNADYLADIHFSLRVMLDMPEHESKIESVIT